MQIIFFACSTEAAQFLYGKDFCTKHQIELIHNAVNCSKFLYDREIAELMRERLEIVDDTVFVHVSNYSPIKNHIFLLDVIEQFIKAAKSVCVISRSRMRRDFRFLEVKAQPMSVPLWKNSSGTMWKVSSKKSSKKWQPMLPTDIPSVCIQTRAV